MNTTVTEADVWAALDRVPDPEMPVLMVTDLGVVREVRLEGRRCVVEYTPTYLGCPAARLMRSHMAKAVESLGLEADVRARMAPAWTSDNVTPRGRQKLKELGIAVSPKAEVGKPRAVPTLRVLNDTVVECPFCGSHETALENAFGGSCCRDLRYCRSCRQPFQHFKS